MAAEAASGWLLWQLADSAFPTGGFAHSGGLEAAWQLGEVPDQEALEHYAADSLDLCGHAFLPFVGAAHDHPARFAEWDRWCDATIANHVANRASRALGQGMLSAAVAAFPAPEVKRLKADLRRDHLAGHLAPVAGTLGALLGVEREPCLRLFLFLHLRTLVSSAVRLGIVGPLAGQGLQYRLSATAEAVLGRCADLGPAQATATTPLHDLFHGHHDRLYSRLFMS
jgi:urease accessory protein